MFKKAAIALVALTLPLTAAANWSLGGGYINLSDDSDGAELSVGGLYGSAAYKYQLSNKKFALIPELRLGTGISDDTENGVDIELERFVGLSVKAQYEVNDNINVFFVPGYANAKLKASYNGRSISDDEWEFGAGAGLDYEFNDKTSVILSYEQFDDTDVFSAGFAVSF